MTRISRLLAVLPLLVATATVCWADEPVRTDVVRERSADVMPFEMMATTHVFTKSPTGGVQRVVVKNAGAAQQIQLVRGHLRDIADKFRRRDFSGPEHVHGAQMPGLAALRGVPPQDLAVVYRDLPAGAEIEYSSSRASIVVALHQWFDAQLADHGTDAIAGHDHAMPHHP